MEKSAAEASNMVAVDCTSCEGSSALKAEFKRIDSTSELRELSVAVDCTSLEGSLAGRRMKGAEEDISDESSFVSGEQAGGSCGTYNV